MEWLSHSLAGRDHGGLGENDWCQVGHGVEGLWQFLDLLLPLEWVNLLLDLDCPPEVSSLSCSADSAPMAQLRVNGSVKCNGHGSTSGFLKMA